MIQSILKNFPTINPDWLILGEGEIYRPAIQKQLFNRTDEVKQADNEELKSKVEGQKDDFKPSQNHLNEDGVEQVLVFFKNKTFSSYKPKQD